MSKRYEYTRVLASYDSAVLNKYGFDGWELSAVTAEYVYFKREIQSEPPPPTNHTTLQDQDKLRDEYFWGKIAAMTDEAVDKVVRHKYTEDDFRKAFEAGKKLNGFTIHSQSQHFPTFKDYLASIHKTT